MKAAMGVVLAIFTLLIVDAKGQSPVSLSGVIDIHAHAGPDDVVRTIDAIDLAKLARDRGMRAIVLKNHSQPTSALAYLAKKAAPGLEVIGGIVLNRSVGGINPVGVEQMAAIGDGAGRVVWMPTRDAENQVRFEKQNRPFVAVARNGVLVAEVEDVLKVIAAKNLVLATGHSSPDESLLVIRSAKAAGVRNIIVTHPLLPAVNMSLEQMKEVAGLGAFLELTYNQIVVGPLKIGDFARVIRAVGPDHVILSSDAGAQGQPLHPEALQQFIGQLLNEGFTARDIDLMTKTNPAVVLGLNLKP